MEPLKATWGRWGQASCHLRVGGAISTSKVREVGSTPGEQSPQGSRDSRGAEGPRGGGKGESKCEETELGEVMGSSFVLSPGATSAPCCKVSTSHLWPVVVSVCLGLQVEL